MTITLPYPPSQGRLYATVRGRRVLSREGRTYKARAAAIAMQAGLEPVKGDLEVSIEFYRPRRAGDIDNFFKVVFDSLTGVAWEDDSQVVSLHARRHDTDRRNPRAVVTIEAVN